MARFLDRRSRAGAIGELKKVRLDGSPAVTLAKVAPLRGATWGSNEIVFATVERDPVVASASNRRHARNADTSRPKDRRSHSLPHMLPDGRGVLYTIGAAQPSFADGQIAVMSLATGDTHVVLDQASTPAMSERSPRVRT